MKAEAPLFEVQDLNQAVLRVHVPERALTSWLALDVSPSMAVDVGYDFTRWHAAFTNSTILGSTDRALLVESRDHAATIGIRFKFRP